MDNKDIQINVLAETIGALYKDLAGMKAALITEQDRTAHLAYELEQCKNASVETEELIK
jgi:hypothetical protein